MKKIAYIAALAGALILGTSCEHKTLGMLGLHEKDLNVIYDWSDFAPQDNTAGNAGTIDSFLMRNIDRLSTHVMPFGKDYHVDTLIVPERLISGPDLFKNTLFPARVLGKDGHFTGVYNIFSCNLDLDGLARYADTTDMYNTIPTLYTLTEDEDIICTQTKATSLPQTVNVPHINDLPFCNPSIIQPQEQVFFGSKLGEMIMPGVNEHEVHEATLKMKELKNYYFNIEFNLPFIIPGYQQINIESMSIAFLGLTAGYDLLNDKAVGSFNYCDKNPNLMQSNNGNAFRTNFETFGIAPETGKCEIVLSAIFNIWKGNDTFTYAVYTKADITDEVNKAAKDPQYSGCQLELFQNPIEVPASAVPSTIDNIVWNEL